MSGDRDFLPFHRPNIGDEEVNAVSRCLKSGWLTTGPETAEFEKEFAQYLGCEYALAVNSGTAALHLALEACGIGAGDRVITTPYTFTASAEVIRYLGADPLFVDIDESTLNIDPESVRLAIESTREVKAVLPVHIAGLPCAMDELQEITRPRGLSVIEDAAHALPANHGGRHVGTMSTATAFSFYATKTLTTGEGGMLVTDDAKIADRAKVMRLHGIDRDVFNRYTTEKPSWHYEIVAPGFKYNMPDLAAAIGRVQLRKLEQMRLAREQIVHRYNDAFSGLPVRLPAAPPIGDQHSWHLYILRLECGALTIDRDQFIALMTEAGIGTSVHFIPLHIQPYWRTRYGLVPDDFPRATAAFQCAVSLPVYPDMSNDDIQRVIDTVTDILTRHQK